MTIAVDSSTTYQVPDTGLGSVSFAHTVAGSDRYLLLGVAMGLSDQANTFSSGPAYNGVALTSLKDSLASPNSQCRVQVFGLIAPATGAHNLTFGMSGSGDGRTVAIVRSFTGVHQTTPVGTAVSASGDGGATTLNVASAVGELVADFLAAWGSGTPTVGAGQTQRANSLNISGNGLGASSDEAGATTVTMSWTDMPGNDWAICAVPLKPAGGGAATLEQEGYRIRNDDGSESSASWKAAQDTAVSMTLGAARVRVLLDATNDPASKAVGLKYAVNGGQKRSVN